MLERLLQEAKARSETAPKQDEEPLKAGPKFKIGTFNAISPLGLERFSKDRYEVLPMQTEVADQEEIHGIMLRSFKLGSSDVPDTVRAVARCGSGTNNIDVEALSERGIPVFNTPGANANAVKELAICGILLSARGVVEGIGHTKTLIDKDDSKNDYPKIKKQVESDKKMFVGHEVMGKKLGVIGLGHIGASVAQTAIDLGMEVVGFDPAITLDAAWRLPGDVLTRANTLAELCESCDFITLHVPYMKATHHLIDATLLRKMKPGCSIINFARGELVDSSSMRQLYDSGERTGRYITDFVDESLHDHPKVITMPHLGASTAEAEENAAGMAAMELMDFIETGTVQNSVNFPTTKLERVSGESIRICIVNQNVPGMLGLIMSTLGNIGANIIQQINTSRGSIAYNVIDIADTLSAEQIASVQDDISKLEGILSSRVVSARSEPGFFKLNK